MEGGGFKEMLGFYNLLVGNALLVLGMRGWLNYSVIGVLMNIQEVVLQEIIRCLLIDVKYCGQREFCAF